MPRYNPATSAPGNWAVVKLGQVTELKNGRAFKPSDWSNQGVPIVRIQNLRSPTAPYNFFQGPIDDKFRIENGDLLFAWSGTPGTSFGAHIWNGGTAILNQHIFRVDFNREVLTGEFLKLVIDSQLPNLIGKAKGAAGLKHLNKSTIEHIVVPVPPLSEQKRIVEKLNETVGRVEAALSALRGLQTDCINLETSLLDSAVRSATSTHSGSYRLISEVGEVTLGRQRAPQYHSGSQMKPYLRVANVQDDYIDVSDVMRMNFSKEEFARYSLKNEDILLNEGQSLELVGRAAMFHGEVNGACFTNTLIRFRAGPQIVPQYALMVFRHYQKSGEFRRIAKITTNLAHLGASRFGQLRIPVPPLETQRELAEKSRELIIRTRDLALKAGQLIRMGELAKVGLEASALSGDFLNTHDSQDATPTIKEPLRIERTSVRIQRRPKGMVQENRMKKPRNVVAALASSRREVSSQRLFRACGYATEASVAEVERFFIDLRDAIRSGKVTRRKVRGEDTFSLRESSVEN